MRKAVLAATAALCVAPASVDAHKHSSKAERYFAHRCDNNSRSGVFACLHRAALHWGQSYPDMKTIAWRESRWRYGRCAVNPIAVGREHATGLMQFLPSTFASTPYRSEDICNPKYNALAAAWMWRAGRKGEWSTA